MNLKFQQGIQVIKEIRSTIQDMQEVRSSMLGCCRVGLACTGILCSPH
jgi:hypothetical protein